MSPLAILTVPVELLLPPTGLAVLALLVALAWRGGRRSGWRRGVLVLLLGALLLLATPIVSDSLLATLSPGEASEPGTAEAAAPGAIVVLSAELARTADGRTYDIGPVTLERERTAAALARRTGLPVLVTGGVVGDWPALGPAMRDSMRDDFGVSVRWTEDASRTTWENAQFSAALLRADGISRVYLVTHGWHMRRALIAFRRAGIEAVPMPVRRNTWPPGRPLDFLPRASAWQSSYFAIHEWVGLAWYALRP